MLPVEGLSGCREAAPDAERHPERSASERKHLANTPPLRSEGQGRIALEPTRSQARRLTMRLLVYSQDGMGLGHLRRTGNIAQEVLARVPDANVLILADSRATPIFPPHPGIDYL